MRQSYATRFDSAQPDANSIDLDQRVTRVTALDHLAGASGPRRRIALPILIAATSALFVAMAVSIVDMRHLDLAVLLRWGAASIELGDGAWWRVVTASFAHANLEHLVGNMIALWLIGRLVEGVHGTRTFLAVYLLAGVVSTAAHVVAYPRTVVLGASGAVFGCLAVVIGTVVQRWNHVEYRVRTRVLMISTVVAAYGVLAGALMPRVSGIGHLVGFLVGAACSVVIGWVAREPVAFGDDDSDDYRL